MMSFPRQLCDEPCCTAVRLLANHNNQGMLIYQGLSVL